MIIFIYKVGFRTFSCVHVIKEKGTFSDTWHFFLFFFFAKEEGGGEGVLKTHVSQNMLRHIFNGSRNPIDSSLLFCLRHTSIFLVSIDCASLSDLWNKKYCYCFKLCRYRELNQPQWKNLPWIDDTNRNFYHCCHELILFLADVHETIHEGINLRGDINVFAKSSFITGSHWILIAAFLYFLKIPSVSLVDASTP